MRHKEGKFVLGKMRTVHVPDKRSQGFSKKSRNKRDPGKRGTGKKTSRRRKKQVSALFRGGTGNKSGPQ